MSEIKPEKMTATEYQQNEEFNLSEIYKLRRAKLATYLSEKGIGAAVFIDNEDHRCPSLRYFTGHPTDAVFVINVDGKCVLSPWDENLAKEMAVVNKIVPFTRYERDDVKAVSAMLKLLKVPGNSKVEIPSSISYPDFLHFVDGLSNYDVLCREEGVEKFATELRAVKDDYELNCIRTAAKITDNIIDIIEAKIKTGEITTEMDVALLIEKECRLAGCEGTGFDTLAAGPARSFAIHCFPPYTSGSFPAEGLSILDFGIKYKGYTSDVTLTIAKGSLSEAQEKQLALVENAYNQALNLYQKDLPIRGPAQKVDEIFAKAKRFMPHSLGHGIGLETHEAPSIRIKTPQEEVFKVGMVATLEPGLYDPELGGCRFENDVLITENGPEVLTHSRIIRF